MNIIVFLYLCKSFKIQIYCEKNRNEIFRNS